MSNPTATPTTDEPDYEIDIRSCERGLPMSNEQVTHTLTRFAHVEITDEEIPAHVPHQRHKLGEQQRFVLDRVIEHGGWYLGCSWNPYAIIEPTLRSLERRGLVESHNRETPLGRRMVYTATQLGMRS